MLINTKNIILKMLAAVGAASMAVACASDGPQPEEKSVGFNVVAEVAREVAARSTQESGRVVNGTYNLSFPQNDNDNTYALASVVFGKEGVTPGIGVVTVPVDRSLEWAGVGGGSMPTFYLDNVDAGPTAGETPMTVVFSDTYNPYKAAPYDDENGTNDLLWGEQTAYRNSRNINFSLHHNMSRLRIQITVDRTYASPGQLDLDGAQVQITSINQTPLSFNRLDGNLALSDENDAYTTLTLMDTDSEWASATTDPENENIETYVTPDFVLPPQGLLENELRPRLIIRLADGTEYSGILPHAMLIDDGVHADPSYPVALYFLKEHILTIRTVITEQPPSLAFMPVTVIDWVDKGDFTLEAHQAGIYRADEFYKLITYYNQANTYQLSRYGRYVVNPDDNSAKWVFEFWNSVVLDAARITDMIKVNPELPFEFDFKGYKVFVKTGNAEPATISEAALYRLVTQ